MIRLRYATVETPTRRYRQASVLAENGTVTVSRARDGAALDTLTADLVHQLDAKGRVRAKLYEAVDAEGVRWTVKKECGCKGRETIIQELV